MKSSVFWPIMSGSPVEVNRNFGGTRHLHLQDWGVSQARNQHEAGIKSHICHNVCFAKFEPVLTEREFYIPLSGNRSTSLCKGQEKAGKSRDIIRLPHMSSAA
jgi:hypothetical protein